MAKSDGAVRRRQAREEREDAIEERRAKAREEKNLCCGVSSLHVFFLLLFFLPTMFGVADYFFKVSEVPGGAHGALDPSQSVWREKLKAFYGENNPGKIGEIPKLLARFLSPRDLVRIVAPSGRRSSMTFPAFDSILFARFFPLHARSAATPFD